MITRIEYCQYLLSSQTNYMITNFADHVEGLSDDKIRRYLVKTKLMSLIDISIITQKSINRLVFSKIKLLGKFEH